MAQKSTVKKNNKSKTAKKNSAKNKRTHSERVAIEVFGIILVALGALFGVYLYSGSDDMLGTIISSFLLGTTGLFAYAVPVILIFFGFFVILSGRQKRTRGSYLSAIIAVYSVICIIHLASSESLRTLTSYGKDGYQFKDYLNQWFQQFPLAWKEPILYHVGGGILGMFFMAPLYILGGYPLCYIVSVSALIICVLLLTGFSIKAYTEAFGTKVKDQIENVKNEYFSDDEDEYDEEDSSDYKPAREWQKDYSKRSSSSKSKKNLSFDELFEVPAPESNKKEKPAVSQAATAPSYPLVNMPASSQSKSSESTITNEKRPDPDNEEYMPSTAKMKRKSTFFYDIDEEGLPVAKPKGTESKNSTSDTIPSSSDESNSSNKPKRKKTSVSEPILQESSASKTKVDSSDDSDLPIAIPESINPNPAALYVPPSIDCLNKSESTYSLGNESPEATARLLEETLQSFNISASVVNISVGPVVTRYELKPAPGIRVSKIAALADDLALALAAARVRIEAPIPGKSAVGIEVPNKETATVLLRDIIESPEFKNSKSTSTMAMGKDITGRIVVADLAKMPHMLIAGSTGSGKSVCINDIIISMIYKSSPQEIQLILIDPKVVELSVFSNLPHLRVPVVTEPKKAASALRWAVNEMDMRYRKFSEFGARDLNRYNSVVDDPKKKMAKLIIIIDELADLMMVAPEDVEDSICRIAQLGRAAGIHLIVATQRPSADIITGLIKANIPSRCAFAVSSSIDSRIILDTTGAEKLLGRGDMLFHPNGAGKPTRCQGAFVSDEEVERVMSHFKKENVHFDEQLLNEINNEAKGGPQGSVFGEGKQEDELLGEAVRVVLENGQASISMIQRRLRVGYARAARLVDMMEQAKYVSGFDGSKPRQVLITQAEYNRVFGNGTADPDADDTALNDDVDDDNEEYSIE